MNVLLLRNPDRSLRCPLSEGETGEVSDELGKVLVGKGLAVCLDNETVAKATEDLNAYKERQLEGVSEQPAVAEAEPPAIKKRKPKKPDSE